MKLPNYTLLYNIICGTYVGTGWEFYDEHETAKARFKELVINEDYCVTLRPFFKSDIVHMGAVHHMNVPNDSEYQDILVKHFENYSRAIHYV